MADIAPAVARALTDPQAFKDAPDHVLSEAWTHIHDAIAQVQGEADELSRQRMLNKLPPHIKALVKEWVNAFWGVDVYAVATGDVEVRHLPLAGITALVRKKGP